MNKLKGLRQQSVIMGAAAGPEFLRGAAGIAEVLGVRRETVWRWQRAGLMPRWKYLPRQVLSMYLGQLALTHQQAVAVSTHSPEQAPRGGGLVPASGLLAPMPSRYKKTPPKGFSDAPVVVIE